MVREPRHSKVGVPVHMKPTKPIIRASDSQLRHFNVWSAPVASAKFRFEDKAPRLRKALRELQLHDQQSQGAALSRFRTRVFLQPNNSLAVWSHFRKVRKPPSQYHFHRGLAAAPVCDFPIFAVFIFGLSECVGLRFSSESVTFPLHFSFSSPEFVTSPL